MPSIDMESLLHDIVVIKVQTQNYLNNYYGNSKAYTVNAKVLNSLSDVVVRTLRHIYTLMNKSSDEVKSVTNLTETLSKDDIDKFNEIIKQIVRTCNKVEGTLNNYYSAGPQVMSDLLIDITDLNRFVSNMVEILNGKGSKVGIEENQDLDVLEAEDIDMGQLYLVYDKNSKKVDFGISRSVIQTSRGKTISSNEDGSEAVPVPYAVYLDPSRFVSDKMIEVLNTLYEYERDSEEDQVRTLARETEDKVLDFIKHIVDEEKIVDTAIYKMKYFKN